MASDSALWLAVGAVVVILAILLLFGRAVIIRYRYLTRINDERIEERVTSAIDTTKRLSYPAVFLKASEFIALGRLVPYEKLRDAKKLIFRDTYQALGVLPSLQHAGPWFQPCRGSLLLHLPCFSPPAHLLCFESRPSSGHARVYHLH